MHKMSSRSSQEQHKNNTKHTDQQKLPPRWENTLGSNVVTYLKVRQRHLRQAELAARLSVFTFPAQVVGNLFPHHSLFTFTQRTRDLEERTHVQVVLHTDRTETVCKPTGCHGFTYVWDTVWPIREQHWEYVSQASAADSSVPGSH